MKRWMLLGLLACACGSSNDGGGTPDSGTPHGTGSFTGTVNGHSLIVNDAVFGIDPYAKIVTLVASDRSNLCTLLGNTTFPGGTVTVLGVAILNYSNPPLPSDAVAGTYDWFPLSAGGVPTAGMWFDGAFALPTDCNGGGEAHLPTGGTVTVTQMGAADAGSHLKATYTNVTFDGGTGGMLNGNVDAIYCAAATVNPSCGKLLLARPPAAE
jgi:hypothetical protein